MITIVRSFAAATGLALVLVTTAAIAAPKDYAFEPISADIRNGSGVELAVRIVHKPTAKPVEGAVLFRTRLDMTPENMEGMTAKHSPLPSNEPGVYKFRADLTMQGGWAFKVMAKIPGEADTVQGTVVFKAK